MANGKAKKHNMLIPFQNEGAPTSYFDKVDSAHVGRAFYVGDDILNISVDPPEFYKCREDKIKNAVWERLNDANKIDGNSVSDTTPTVVQALTWNESEKAWKPQLHRLKTILITRADSPYFADPWDCVLVDSTEGEEDIIIYLPTPSIEIVDCQIACKRISEGSGVIVFGDIDGGTEKRIMRINNSFTLICGETSWYVITGS